VFIVLRSLFWSVVVMCSVMFSEFKFISVVTGMCFQIRVDASIHIPF
jgi:hypothetical protein